MRARRNAFPDAMLATATHDHKRGEDVRARLAVLSECPDEWGAALRGWIGRNARASDGDGAPSRGRRGHAVPDDRRRMAADADGR